jgi:hypothetical protein
MSQERHILFTPPTPPTPPLNSPYHPPPLTHPLHFANIHVEPSRRRIVALGARRVNDTSCKRYLMALRRGSHAYVTAAAPCMCSGAPRKEAQSLWKGTTDEGF